MLADFTWSKTLDNVSEIFNTFGGGTTVAIPQNPFSPGAGEYGFSGLNFPYAFTMQITEQLPFFKEQHGFMGHVLGGWSLSGNYIWESGQNYSPLNIVFPLITNGPGGDYGPLGADFFDNGFLGPFNDGVAGARPFLANPGAPANTVAIYAGDACGIFGLPGICALPGTQLISLNNINAASVQQSFNPATYTPQTVTNQQVRFIANTGMAEQVFGTPFGNVPRNYLSDAPTNIANVSFLKNIKLGERASFEFHVTMENAFNHANFATVNPFVENAGNPTFGNAFAVPQLTGDSIPGSNLAASRRIYFGGTLRF